MTHLRGRVVGREELGAENGELAHHDHTLVPSTQLMSYRHESAARLLSLSRLPGHAEGVARGDDAQTCEPRRVGVLQLVAVVHHQEAEAQGQANHVHEDARLCRKDYSGGGGEHTSAHIPLPAKRGPTTTVGNTVTWALRDQGEREREEKLALAEGEHSLSKAYLRLSASSCRAVAY